MSIILESELTDLGDDDLIRYMAALYERVKRLGEAMKEDETIKDMRAEIKAYEDDRYGREKKLLGLKLKVARDQAKVRGLVFKLPD